MTHHRMTSDVERLACHAYPASPACSPSSFAAFALLTGAAPAAPAPGPAAGIAPDWDLRRQGAG